MEEINDKQKIKAKKKLIFIIILNAILFIWLAISIILYMEDRLRHIFSYLIFYIIIFISLLPSLVSFLFYRKNKFKKQIIFGVIIFLISLVSVYVFLSIINPKDIHKVDDKSILIDENNVNYYFNQKFSGINEQSKIWDTDTKQNNNATLNNKGQVVDKFIKGKFQVVSTGEIFEYQERFDPDPTYMPDYNSNAVNDCVSKDCDFVYFEKQSNNTQGKVSVFNDKDKPLIGKISELSFLIYKDGVKFWSDHEVLPHTIGDLIVYKIINDQYNISHSFKEDLCVSFQGGGSSCHSPSYNKGEDVYFFNDGTYNGVFKKNDIIKTKLISYQYFTFPDTGEVFPVVKR